MPDVLLATDADNLRDEVQAALESTDRPVRRVHHGADVVPAVAEATPELVVLDMQIGNMGGMATCMALRLEEGAERLPHVPVLILLDRAADEFLARRCGADGWLVKPLDSFRLRRAADAVIAGRPFSDGLPIPEVTPTA